MEGCGHGAGYYVLARFRGIFLAFPLARTARSGDAVLPASVPEKGIEPLT
jgi:hypothetical protein